MVVPIGLVYSIHDSTEVAIQKMIDASQRMLDVNSQVEGEAREEGWGINPVMERHLELEIERDVAKCSKRCEGKLRELFKLKERQNEEEAMHIEDTQRLVTEIEMLKVVLFLVSRIERRKEQEEKRQLAG
jgi:hypothetical protein